MLGVLSDSTEVRAGHTPTSRRPLEQRSGYASRSSCCDLGGCFASARRDSIRQGGYGGTSLVTSSTKVVTLRNPPLSPSLIVFSSVLTKIKTRLAREEPIAEARTACHLPMLASWRRDTHP